MIGFLGVIFRRAMVGVKDSGFNRTWTAGYDGIVFKKGILYKRF